MIPALIAEMSNELTGAYKTGFRPSLLECTESVISSSVRFEKKCATKLNIDIQRQTAAHAFHLTKGAERSFNCI